MIINFIERYFYLICFCQYALEQGPDGFSKTFKAWLDDKKDLRQIATEGKDKLEWSRTVDAEKLEQLKEMMASPDYKAFGKQFPKPSVGLSRNRSRLHFFMANERESMVDLEVHGSIIKYILVNDVHFNS